MKFFVMLLLEFLHLRYYIIIEEKLKSQFGSEGVCLGPEDS